MRTFDEISALRAYVRALRDERKNVGFVPTMGALHEGHLSLIRKAKSECDAVIVSVFVNPTQFGPGEDFESYPRNLAQDSKLAQQAGADAIFNPRVEQMYPDGFQTVIDLPELAENWEGRIRPGHFKGVATICTKLFNAVQPDRAYFGQKDYQQLKLVERMVKELHLPVTIVPVATVREADGLALSSRNVYLTAEERSAARVLSCALQSVTEMFKSGVREVRVLESALEAAILSSPLAQIDYAVVVDAERLTPLQYVDDKAVALVAVRFGATRLLDNTVLK